MEKEVCKAQKEEMVIITITTIMAIIITITMEETQV